MIEAATGGYTRYFITGKVIKRDAAKKLVWLAEFGPQAIPVVGFDYDVKYYDTDQRGDVTRKQAKVNVVTPAIGATVLVARELGVSRMPRCLGVFQGKGWIK